MSTANIWLGGLLLTDTLFRMIIILICLQILLIWNPVFLEMCIYFSFNLCFANFNFLPKFEEVLYLWLCVTKSCNGQKDFEHLCTSMEMDSMSLFPIMIQTLDTASSSVTFPLPQIEYHSKNSGGIVIYTCFKFRILSLCCDMF